MRIAVDDDEDDWEDLNDTEEKEETTTDEVMNQIDKEVKEDFIEE